MRQWMVSKVPSFSSTVPFLFVALISYVLRPELWLDEEILARSTELYVAPLGPFFGLTGLEKTQILAIARCYPWLHTACLACLVVPARRIRIAGGSFAALLALVIDGINYSSGKIDHQLIIHCLPALAVLDWRFRPVWTRTALFFFYVQSCLAKACSGWFLPEHRAIFEWLHLYRDFYHANTLTSDWLLATLSAQSPVWKLLDVLTVLSEGAIALLWLKPRFLPPFLFLGGLTCFHLVIKSFFGIDFSSLTAVYAWALWMNDRERHQHWLIWAALGSLIFISTTVNAHFLIAMTAISLTLALAARLGAPLLDQPGPAVPRPGKLYPLWWALNLGIVALGVVGYEPFPSLGGPLFRAAKDAEIRTLCIIDFEDAQTKAIGLEEYMAQRRLNGSFWIPKFIQYAMSTGQMAPVANDCVHHNYGLVQPYQPRMTAAVDDMLQRSGVRMRVRRVPIL